MVLLDDYGLSTFYVPYDATAHNIYEALYQELQTHQIISIKLFDGMAVVKVNKCAKRSAVRQTMQIAGIPVVDVDHHSALLPGWLSLRTPKRFLTIVHIDAHNDLGCPNLLRHGELLIDRWTGEIVDPDAPPTVHSAVDSTAIEIGSYLTMALYWLPVTRLIWLCPEKNTGVVRSVTNPCGLRLGWSYSDALDNRVERLSVIPVLEDASSILVRIVKSTEALRNALKEQFIGDIVLDVDLDYFDNSAENVDLICNQPIASSVPDEWIYSQQVQISRILDALPLERVVNVGIARSPGFCPVPKAMILAEMFINSLSERG